MYIKRLHLTPFNAPHLRMQVSIKSTRLYYLPCDVAMRLYCIGFCKSYKRLTVRYLLDPVGAGANHNDLKQHYIDLGNGIPFATSLQNNFGVSLSALQTNWFTIMDTYLKNPNRINTEFTAIF